MYVRSVSYRYILGDSIFEIKYKHVIGKENKVSTLESVKVALNEYSLYLYVWESVYTYMYVGGNIES